MNSAFHYATAFNQPLPWNTSSVGGEYGDSNQKGNFIAMFNGAERFNQPVRFSFKSIQQIW